MTGPAGSNWAEVYDYRAAALERPTSVDEVIRLVERGTPLRALGSRHSFNDLADTTGALVDLAGLPVDLVIDEEARTASFGAGVRYGELAALLEGRGWAIHNMASLPHISVAGAVATATHGSGDRNGNLATAVAGLEFVNGAGRLVRLSRSDADFSGAIVSLGAIGLVTRITLDIEPSFQVRQDLYDELPWDAALEHLDRITSSAYSVSMFTRWVGETIGQVWLKSRMDQPVPPTELFGARPAAREEHMVPEQEPLNTTTQGGVPGAWNDRLPHFKMGFTPSNGTEIQSEFLVPRARAVEALRSLREIADRIEPLLLVTELRTMAADQLWLSGAYGTDALGIHFTWKKLPAEVTALLPEIEARLLPLGARPHWGKVFTAGADRVAPLYPRLRDFAALVARHDPQGLFHNAFLTRTLGI
ncbi:FAD-binding protein [Galbitalea soli]|uniref:FAD-binding protein n=1 Tax=Galbitalea soli TaxID=1268042 RepID=A0A7C9PKH9_9MICO|nr:FAD-binding protein [Galbitalea soli]NEM89805.1 FAD-binding protein [Galbitalea soli]NYJ30509.1 xylitol oxidase [Galbitalea soli]